MGQETKENLYDKGTCRDHCWETLPIVLMSNPPQFKRKCKHCGFEQTGMSQEPVNWR